MSACIYSYVSMQLLKPVMRVTPGRELAMSKIVARLGIHKSMNDSVLHNSSISA